MPYTCPYPPEVPVAAAKSRPTVRPHRRQPTRLPRPWDSPGKNTGVGCHFLLQGMKVRSESEVAQSCPTLSDPMDCSPPGSSIHGVLQARVLEWGVIAFSESTSGQQWLVQPLSWHRGKHSEDILHLWEVVDNVRVPASHPSEVKFVAFSTWLFNRSPVGLSPIAILTAVLLPFPPPLPLTCSEVTSQINYLHWAFVPFRVTHCDTLSSLLNTHFLAISFYQTLYHLHCIGFLFQFIYFY